MIFKKKTQENTAEQDQQTAVTSAGAAAAKARLKAGYIQCAVLLGVIAITVFAWGTTRAWFANNREVLSDNNTVVSDSATASLFISPGTQNADKLYSLGLVSKWSADAKLFPISTRDLSAWWYVSAFTPTLNAAGTAYESKASAYTSVSTSSGLTETAVTTSSGGIATYNNALDGAGKVAYAFSTYKLYTNSGSMDVYLDPTEPITVSYSAIDASGKDLMGALRIGVSVGGTMKFIYAPITENGTGNSSGNLSANQYYAVNDASSVSTLGVLTDLSGWKATATGDPADPYSAGTATSLGTATTDGIQVKLFVWLEGTDAQAILGVSDDDVQGINVNIKYVGIAQ